MEGISEKKYIMEQGFWLPHKWRDNLGISSRLWSQRDVDTDHLTLQTDGILLVVPAEVMSGGGVLWLSCYHPHAPHCNLTQTSRCGQWGRTGRIPSLLYFLFTPLVELIYPDPFTISVLARTAASVLQEFGTISRRYSWGTRLNRTHSHSPRKRNQIRGKTIG